MKHLHVSVRSFVEHILRSGDLVQGFSEPLHPLEAIRAHQKVQSSRPPGYLKEVTVSHQIEKEDFLLELRGRIDGVLEHEGRITIEEIKTTGGNPPEDNQVHWGQVRVYAYIYATDRDLEEVDTRLTYYSLKSGQVLESTRAYTREELASFFDGLATRYLNRQSILENWRRLRDRSVRNAVFPFDSYRPGQRQLAIAIYRAIRDNDQLLAQAPTGIGKTMAAIFPALKAMTEGLTEKLFYLTGRSTGKLAAEQALIKLAECGVRAKSLTLTAKQKICFNPRQACNGEECQYARGFYDRLDGAVATLLRQDLLTREGVEEVARTHRVCPFELSLELSLWVDCIICDYNYVFDPRVNLRQFFQGKPCNHTIVVDEAHNLPDRARKMFSAELEKQDFLNLKRVFKSNYGLSRSLGRINWLLARLKKQYGETGERAASNEPPETLYPKLREFVSMAESTLSDESHRRTPERDSLLDLYFQAGNFLRVSELYDRDYVTCYESGDRNLKIKLFCLEPSRQLGQVLRQSRATILFSATLTPLEYFQSLLGCGARARKVFLPSPFPQENLCLTIADRTSTLYRRRSDTKHEVTSLLEAFVSQKTGNYLLFFPSYEYMRLILDCFSPQTTQYEMAIQTPTMTEQEREHFVARYAKNHSPGLVGFAVMGGIFGEGIDLVGERLTGAAIVGVGLPALSLERDLIRRHYDDQGLTGFDFAYRFPGINRVLQAAGRVIRSERERGAVLLIDDRYTRYSYKLLLPPEWTLSSVSNDLELAARLQRFWDVQTNQVFIEGSDHD